MTKGKISITIGNLKINYEGSDEFIKKNIPKIFDLEEIYKIVNEGKVVKKKPSKPKKNKNINTINDMSSFLKVKTLDDLILTSFAYQHLSKNADVVSYRDLYNTMKNANKFFKKKYVGKVKGELKQLSYKNKIVERGDSKYKLTDKEITKFVKKLQKYL